MHQSDLRVARRDMTRFHWPIHEFESLESFESAEVISRGIISIQTGRTFIDLFFDPRGSETTAVTFHAALRHNAKLPLFAGGTAFQDGPVNRILVSDPGLYVDESLGLAWFAGTEELRLQSILPRMLLRLLRESGSTRTLFFGPSGGGFAALYYSRLFPDSLAVAMNPQTVLMHFSEPHRNAYARAAFGAGSPEEVGHVFEKQIDSDLREIYGGKVSNHLLFIQNWPDHHHVNEHLVPFLESLESHQRTKVLFGDWGPGHTGPSPSELRALAKNLTSRSGNWGSIMRNANVDWLVPQDSPA